MSRQPKCRMAGTDGLAMIRCLSVWITTYKEVLNMIINQPGAEFFFEDVCYKIGDRIVGTDASEYQGLLGSILSLIHI